MSGKQSKKNTSSVDKNKVIDPEDDFEGIDADLNDSLQKNNELFTLKSQINSLKIEKQKLSIEHEHALKGVEQKNKQLSSQNHKLKRQNSNLSNKVLALQRQIEQLKQLIDSHKHQFENNRKTADFHRSVEDGEQNIGASELINELLQKDKQILQLKATLQRKQSTQSLNTKNFDSGSLSVQKKQEQNRNLKTTIEQLKAKQIAYKRQYEEILIGKQELIRKITAQSEESMKRVNESKERGINEARKQVELGLKNQELLKHQIKKLEQKSQNMESMLNKLGGEYAKKQKQLIMRHEQEKQQITKSILQKIKKQYKQKEQKIKKSENRINELQNELVISKQQTSKLKNQTNSMSKINKILQSNIIQIEQYKSKLQSLLQEKDKQMTNTQQQYFIKLTQLQRLRIEDNNRYEKKILSIEEELISKKNLAQKYQKMLEQKSNKSNSVNLKQENGLLEEIQALRNSKCELSQQVQALEEKNKLEIEKFYDLQRSMRNQYQNRISTLEEQLMKLRQKLSEQKKQLFQQNLESMENIQEKYKKLQNISQLQEFQIKEKMEEIQKLGKNKIDKQKQIGELNQKLTQYKEKYDNLSVDYASLESLYEEIKDKYKTGVENMKGQIETMTRKIGQQRKNAQKRRMQGTKAEQQLRQQLRQSRQHIRELEEKLDQYKNLREQRKDEDQKVQKITQQVGTLTKQNQSLQTLTKSQSKALKQAQHNNKIHEEQKSKLLQYIQQLQQNTSILSTKLTISSNKEISYSSTINKLDKQIKNLKLEYSVCLEEMNLVLQKCKQLEEVSRESISHMEIIRQKYEMLNLQYMDLNDQKNKHCQELYGAYDQVNKLNMVLMSKQQQLVKFKNLADNAQKNKQFVTQTIHHYMPQQITTIPHGPMIPMTQSMPATFNSMQVQYVSNSLSPILSPNSDVNANVEQNRSMMRPGVRYDQKNNVFVPQKNSNPRLDENRDRNYGYKNSIITSKSKNTQDIPNVKRVTL